MQIFQTVSRYHSCKYFRRYQDITLVNISDGIKVSLLLVCKYFRRCQGITVVSISEGNPQNYITDTYHYYHQQQHRYRQHLKCHHCLASPLDYTPNISYNVGLIYPISRVSDQNGVSPQYIMLETHHSGREPSISSLTQAGLHSRLWTYVHPSVPNSSFVPPPPLLPPPPPPLLHHPHPFTCSFLFLSPLLCCSVERDGEEFISDKLSSSFSLGLRVCGIQANHPCPQIVRPFFPSLCTPTLTLTPIMSRPCYEKFNLIDT